MVVGDQHADHTGTADLGGVAATPASVVTGRCTVMVVPRPGTLSTWKLPPAIRARSAIPTMPKEPRWQRGGVEAVTVVLHRQLHVVAEVAQAAR